MSRRLKNDFITEDSFGVEANTCVEVAATTVDMADGFVYNQIGAAGTLQAGDILGGSWQFDHTAGAAEIGAVYTTNEIFQFMIGQPIRFIADIHFIALGTECNMFVGCGNAFATAMTITAGGGMKVTGDHFGFYFPDSSSAVYANPNNIFCVSQESGVAMITELTAANSLDRVNHVVTDTSRHQLMAAYVPTGPVAVPLNTAVLVFDALVEFWIDGVLVCVHNHSGANQITIAGTELMNFGIYSENITDIITWQVRQLKCRQLRALSQFGG